MQHYGLNDRQDVQAAVAYLFSPDIVPLVDVFRALGDFEESYDVEALDRLEERLTQEMDRASAKGLVSDALLLAFGLRRERLEPLRYAPLRSRIGTRDEFLLMSMIGAGYWQDHLAASDAASALQVFHTQALISLAYDIARRLEGNALRLPHPNSALFALAAEAANEAASPALMPDPARRTRRAAPFVEL